MFPKFLDTYFILKLFEINNKIEKSLLIFQLQKIKLPFHVDWNQTYHFATESGLIYEKNNFTHLSNIGKSLQLMHKSVSLSESEKYFIFSNCILFNPYFENINNFLDSFSLNPNKDFELFKTEKKMESFSLGLEDKIILHELGLVKFLPEKYVLNPVFADKLYQKNQSGSKTMTESELNQILDEQKRIGNLAEKLTLDYEKTYFKQNKWKYQQNNVKIISKDHVNAGYDVESFLSKNSKLDLSGMGDKHIEVKGRKYNDFSFIMSANELKTAEKLSKSTNEKYFIYFWNNLGAKKLPTKPTRIINFEELKITPCENCLNYFVKI